MPAEKGEVERYFWSAGDARKIEDFVAKTKPSVIDNRDTPWIWVQCLERPRQDPERDTRHTAALTKATDILQKLEKRIQEIETDDSIPVRGKKGTLSKKQVRDEVLATAKNDLKEVSNNSKWTCGKWMLFPRHDNVDHVWSTVALSLAKGHLHDSGAFLAKVAPTQPGTDGNATHVICIYMDDVYDLKLVRKVLTTLLTQHGIEPSACKSDLYTLAGIDSNHPTKLRSSIWRPAEVIAGGADEVKRMIASYRSATKEIVTRDGLINSDSEDEKVAQAVKRQKPKSSEKTSVPEGTKIAKRVKSAAARYKENDIFGGGSDDDDG